MVAARPIFVDQVAVGKLDDMKCGELRWTDRKEGWEVLIPSVAYKNSGSSLFGQKPFRLIPPDLLDLYRFGGLYRQTSRGPARQCKGPGRCSSSLRCACPAINQATTTWGPPQPSSQPLKHRLRRRLRLPLVHRQRGKHSRRKMPNLVPSLPYRPSRSLPYYQHPVQARRPASCFQAEGWSKDRWYRYRHLLRLPAAVLPALAPSGFHGRHRAHLLAPRSDERVLECGLQKIPVPSSPPGSLRWIAPTVRPPCIHAGFHWSQPNG